MLYINLMLLRIKSQMQYKASLLLSTFGQFVTAFSSFFGLYFLMSNVDAVGGFTKEQVLICFAVVMLSFSIGELFGGGLATFPSVLGNGEYDRALVRPRSTILQVLAPRIDLTRLGLLVQAALVLAYAIPASGICWTASRAFTLCLMIACGSALFFSLFLVYAAVAFFTVQGLEFMHVFTYGARQFGKYPFSVYGQGVLRFLTWVVPLALFQYYPLLFLLGREQSAFHMLSPLLSLLFLLPAYGLFRFGMSKYKSTGS